jgi:glycosyltransferase involved in cell wall biosynthesis
MTADKGPREAIEVARLAGVPLKIAAKMREQAEIDYFKSEVEPLLSDEVEYIGELDPAEKYQLLGGAIALLNPIQWAEPFGLVMIESLACGTPVMATSFGSVPELIDDGMTGFVRDEAKDLAPCLLDASNLDRSTCRQVAETRFCTARMVADHVDLYTEVIERPARVRKTALRRIWRSSPKLEVPYTEPAPSSVLPGI